MSVRGRVAIITGASGTLGTEVTRLFIAEQAKVVAVCHSQKSVDALHASLVDARPAMDAVCDVTNEEQVAAMVDLAAEELGPPRILLNIVGGYAPPQPVHELNGATWDKVMNRNLKSVFLCSKYVLRHMRQVGYGRIVNISSKIAQTLPGKMAAAAVSKAAVNNLTTCMARELKGTNISVTALMPSIIDSPAMRRAMPDADFKKWVRPDMLAECILFLCQDQAAAINGAILPVFGGV